MESEQCRAAQDKPVRYRPILWFLVFYTIAFSFGYGTLNRFDPRDKGLPDTSHYYQMAVKNYVQVPPPFRFRVLIPEAAGYIWPKVPESYAQRHNQLYLAFLLINSALLAGAAVVMQGLTRVATGVEHPALGTVAAFLLLCSFRIVTSHSCGMVDAGELFFLCAMMYCALRGWWILPPLLMVAGVCAKETVAPLGACGLLVIGVWQGVQAGRWLWQSIGMGTSVLLAAFTVFAIRATVQGPTSETHAFSLDQLAAIPGNMWACIWSLNMGLSFLFLLPLGVWRLHRLHGGFVLAFFGMALLALVLGAYGDIGRNVSRPLINALGPVLAISTAVLVFSVSTHPRRWDEALRVEEEEDDFLDSQHPGS